MKKHWLGAIMICFFVGSASAQLKFGAGLNSNFDQTAIAVKAYFPVQEQWGGQISANLFLASGSPWMLDADAHYVLIRDDGGEGLQFSGFGGIHIVNGFAGLNKDTEMGLNLGGHVHFPVSDNLDVYIEPKVTVISDGEFYLAAGVYF